MRKITHYVAAAALLLGAATGIVYAATVKAEKPAKPAPLYADGEVTLYGDVIYSDNWEESSDYGVYSVNTTNGQLTAVSPTGDYNFRATGGAVYKDGHFYMIKADDYSATWFDYNTDGWDEENEDYVSSTWAATDMTVNPIDNKIYAVMSDGKGGQVLTTVDFNAGQRTEIGKISNLLATLSSDTYGQLYGIGVNGALYKVDSSNGEETLVGATGVNPAGMQSATFDFATGTLYWAASTSSNVGALYTVNTTTGKATLVHVFPGNEQIVGLYSLSAPKAWEGPDMPAAPTNVNAVYDEGQTTITWTAPEKGLHNGTFDATDTKYDIMRLPDSTVVATDVADTKFVDAFTPTQLGAFTYQVTAKNSAGKGGSAKSNVVIAGDAVTPPYAQDFTDESSFALLTLLDADGDNSTWVPSALRHYAYDAGAPFEYTNDWLFTPRLSLKADRLYRIRYAVSAEWAANYPYNIKATVGTAPTQADVQQTVSSKDRIDVPDTLDLSGYFKVENNGQYYVGVNVNGYDIQNILLHYLYVDEGPKFAAPDSVTAVSAKAAADGSAHVSFSFTAPTKTVGGDALNSISAIKVYRDTNLVAACYGITPGNVYTAEDNNPKANSFNNYRIVAENAEGEGLAYEDTVYVGIDRPLPPTNIVASYDPDDAGKVTLTWNDPTTGVNGGFIDPENLTYGIQRAIGRTPTILDTEYKGNSFTDVLDTEGEQACQYYGISSHNISGYSDIATSNVVIKGAPYALPFMETFPNGGAKYLWYTTKFPNNESSAYWDTSRGYLSFSCSWRGGDGAIVQSGKIDPSGAVNPVLEFEYWYRAEGGEDSLNVYLIKNGKDTILVDDEPYTRFSQAKDFEKVSVPITKYIDDDTKFVQVAFSLRTYENGATQMAGVRNIVIRDQQDYDLMAQSISAPATAATGDTIDVATSVYNYGSKTADAYTVDLIESGKVIASQNGSSLAKDSLAKFNFKVPVGTLKSKLNFTFKVNYDNDLVPDNNVSDSAITTINLPVYPAPTDGEGTANNADVNLSWKAPAFEQYTVPEIDGAEVYDSFAVNNIGDWTVRDVDGNPTISDIRVDTYPVNFKHQGEPFGWIVMNPEQAGAQFYNWMGSETGWKPVHGNQYFASFSSADNATTDDWLISPELTGEAQTISFYQHGYYGIEKYEVLYSTTDTAMTSFTSLGQQSSASKWTNVSYDLPEGAKYFAIRNLGGSYSRYFFVDDISFEPLSNKGILKLSGYNIYRDGEKIATVGADELSYDDKNAPDGSHTYQVTAVYNLGESTSTTIEISVTNGISTIANGAKGKNLLNGSRLTFDGQAQVYTLDGKLFFNGNASNGVNLPTGTYIIKAAGETLKAVVK